MPNKKPLTAPAGKVATLRLKAPATLAVVVSLCVGWALIEASGDSTSTLVKEAFGGRGPGVGAWRFLTSIFLHQGFLHLLVNVMALLVFGAAAESIAGSAFFLYVFFFSGIAGALASGICNPLSLTLGASGASLGLLSAFLVLLWWAPERTPQREAPERSMMTFFLIFWAVLRCKPLVAGHWAETAPHWGGLLAGFLACLVLNRHDGRIVLRRGFAVALAVWLSWAALVDRSG